MDEPLQFQIIIIFLKVENYADYARLKDASKELSGTPVPIDIPQPVKDNSAYLGNNKSS